MNVLVTYATRHGATRGIAERIAGALEGRSVGTTVRSVDDVDDISSYDAFVIGSATYAFHWLGEAKDFVHRHEPVLRTKPVWLFSSGPLGEETREISASQAKASAAPKEFQEFEAAIRPRAMRVFYGAFDPDAAPVGVMERIMHAIPPARNAMPAGDFRDWPEIDAWGNHIADELEAIPVTA
jgi:menaquinone-dependent protoporphyrinogen oxidase